jgi:hypothetical protein
MKKNFLCLFIIFFIIIFSFIFSLNYINTKESVIPTDYKVFFRGEDNNYIYTTYVYEVKIHKKKKYKYINTLITINYDDNTYSKEQILVKGKASTLDDIYNIANENKADDYAKIKSNKNRYTIDEVKKVLK